MPLSIVEIVGDVNVLLARVCAKAAITNVSLVSGIITVRDIVLADTNVSVVFVVAAVGLNVILFVPEDMKRLSASRVLFDNVSTVARPTRVSLPPVDGKDNVAAPLMIVAIVGDVRVLLLIVWAREVPTRVSVPSGKVIILAVVDNVLIVVEAPEFDADISKLIDLLLSPTSAIFVEDNNVLLLSVCVAETPTRVSLTSGNIMVLAEVCALVNVKVVEDKAADKLKAILFVVSAVSAIKGNNIVLLANASIVVLPTNVSDNPEGNVSVKPPFIILDISGNISILLLRVWAKLIVTSVSLVSGNVIVRDVP